VARRAQAAGIGIDAEVHGPLPEGVIKLVASAGEQARLAALAVARPEVHWDRLLFSAKESVYKVWSPRTGEWLDFEQAEVSFDEVGERFTARVLAPGPFTTLSGRYVVEDGIVVTAIVLPPFEG
jgi:4'-phosphopantetheinyl transferase EntD